MASMKAIVLNGDLKSALCAVRSLGQAGHEVTVGAERESGMAYHSKFAKDSFVYPSPYTNRAGFVEAVIEQANEIGEKPVVFAFSDATYLSLHEAREELAEVCTLQYPDSEKVAMAFDKASTYSLAKVTGVSTITTWSPGTSEELTRIATNESYPLVLKARQSVTWKEGKGVFGTACFVHSGDELVKKYKDITEETGEAPLIQKFIEGEEYGVEMLADKGEVFARIVHHRLRSLSPTGGASVLKETIIEGELYRELTELAGKLVRALSWSGPIMVEFKVDADSRKPLLMEINGRFWGSLPLSVFAGVDMPTLYADWVCNGKKPEQVVEATKEVTSIHQAGDIAHLLKVLFKRDTMRKVLYPKRLSAVRDFLVHSKATKYDVWSLKDMKPGFMEIVDILKRKK